MSATISEKPEMHDYLVTGETLFVTGAVLAFVSDVALTFRSLVAGNWFGLAIGMIFIVGTLYFVNWLYTGKREARSAAAMWAAVQIVVAATCTFLVLNQEFRWDWRFYKIAEWLPASLSVPSPSYLLGAFKAVAYGFFLYQITQRGPALFFLRRRGGEALEAPSPTTPPEDVHPTGVALPLTADQSDAADTLANTLQSACFALMIGGFFLAVVGGQGLATASNAGWISIGEGVALLALGLLAIGPVTSLRNVKDRGADTAYVTDALAKLGGLFNKQLVLTGLLLALTVGGILIALLGKGQ